MASDQAGLNGGTHFVNSLENTRTYYGSVSRVVHWLTVIIVAIQFAYGFSFVAAGERSLVIFDSLVESLGMLLIPLTLFRLFWICHSGRPKLPASVRPLQAKIARIVQAMMYVMILFCATTGFFVRDQDMFFYTFRIPGILHFDDIEAVHDLHDTAVYFLLFLITLHVGAAFLHACLKDGVVQMMIGRPR